MLNQRVSVVGHTLMKPRINFEQAVFGFAV